MREHKDLEQLADGGHGVQPARRWSRTVLVAALATFVLGTFASLGGVGYAASGANHTVAALKHPARSLQTSAKSQYHNKTAPKVAATHLKTAKPSTVAAAGVVTKSTLPFTGMPLVWPAVAGMILLAAGLALRRRENQR